MAVAVASCSAVVGGVENFSDEESDNSSTPSCPPLIGVGDGVGMVGGSGSWALSGAGGVKGCRIDDNVAAGDD